MPEQSTTRPPNQGVPNAASGDQSLQSLKSAAEGLKQDLPTDRVSFTIDGTVADASALLSQLGYVVAFDPKLLDARVRGTFKNRPVGEVMQSIAVQLDQRAVVVRRPGGSFYAGMPTQDDTAAAVLYVPEGGSREWETIYKTVLTKEGQMASIGDRIVIRDAPVGLERVAQLHAELLKPRPQYMVEVCFVEMNWQAAFFLGVDFDIASAVSASWTLDGVNFDDSFARLTATLTANKQGGVASVVNSMILQVPEGGSAKLVDGRTVPVPKFETFEGGGSRVTNFDEKEAGTILDVSVRSAGESGVTVNIKPELSSIVEYRNDIPIIAKRSIQATVLCARDSCVVIGGLNVDSDLQSRKGMPRFARNSSVRRDESRTRLFLFLRVKEVKNG